MRRKVAQTKINDANSRTQEKTRFDHGHFDSRQRFQKTNLPCTLSSSSWCFLLLGCGLGSSGSGSGRELIHIRDLQHAAQNLARGALGHGGDEADDLDLRKQHNKTFKKYTR
jgi:hypothetical protein